MRFSRIVLLALFAFVVVVDTLAAATDTTGTRIRAKSLRTMPVVRDGIHDARRLQGGKKVADSADTEERGNLVVQADASKVLDQDWQVGRLCQVEARQMKKWLNEGPHDLATHLLWSNLGLDKIAAAERESSAAYKTYVRYATMYDDRLFQRIKSGSNPLIIQGSFGAAELNTKISIWAKAKRPKWYVKKLLDLENTSDKNLAASDEYQIFLKLEQELNQ